MLYNSALTKLEARKYNAAVEDFQEVERQFPFSKWATKGQVMSAFAYYKDNEYGDVIAIVDRFTRLNPGNKDVAYMYYLKALSYYEQIADVRRDQGVTEQAMAALKEVVARFPESDYARDAKLKLDLTADHLAGKHMEIGRFYQKRAKYVAALNRFKDVAEQYQTTNHVEEALYRIVEIYLTLGVEEEAKKYAALLGHNYPDSKWYKYAFRLVAEKHDSPTEPSKATSAVIDFFTFDQDADAERCDDNNGSCKESGSFIDSVTDFF